MSQTCPKCRDKDIFTTQANAEYRAAVLGMRAYFQPECGWWHLTKILDPVSAGYDLPPLGLNYDLDENKYHAGPGLGSTDVKTLVEWSPAHFRAYKSAHKEPTDAMRFGTAFHQIVLEPERFAQGYAILPTRPPGADGKGKAGTRGKNIYIEWKAECANAEESGKDLVSAADWDALHRMRDALFAHTYGAIYFDADSGQSEVSNYWVDPSTKRLCKARIDFHNEAHNAIVDLKSAADASYTGFAKAVAQRRYHMQNAHYSNGWYETTSHTPKFWFFAVEKSPPYAVGFYDLGPDEIDFGRVLVKRALQTYDECTRSGIWPAYDEQPRTIHFPRWGFTERAL